MALQVGELYASLSLKDREFKDGMSRSKKAFGAMGNSLVGMASSLAVQIGSVLSAGIVAKTGIAYNALMEQSAIAWETILGDAKEAEKTIKGLEEMGALTPFEFEGLDKSAKLLNMAGFEGDNLFKTLTNVGDAVSAIGGGQDVLEGVSMALFQMSTKGKVSAEEMNQLAERGIDAWGLMSEGMGISKRELMDLSSQGKVMSEDVLPHLINGMGEAFGGSMQKQSQTFNGLMATLGDNFKILSAEIMKGSFERLKGMLPPVIAIMERLTEGLKEDGLRGALKAVIPEEASGKITALGNLFSKVFNAIKAIVIPVVNTVVSYVSSKLDEMKKFWDQNGAQITQAVKNFWNVIKSIFNAIKPVLIALVKAIWGNIKGVIDGVLKAIQGVIKLFTGIFTGDFKMAFNGIKDIVVGTATAIWNAVNLIFLGRIIGGIKSFASMGVNAVKGFATNIKNNFNSLIDDAFGWGKDLMLGVAKGIGGYVSKVVSQAKEVAKKIGGAIKDFFGIASPSKLMTKYGQYIGQGLSVGMDKQASLIAQSANRMAQSALPSYGRSGVSSAPTTSAPTTGGITQNITINSPKELSASEVARKTKQQTQLLAVQYAL